MDNSNAPPPLPEIISSNSFNDGYLCFSYEHESKFMAQKKTLDVYVYYPVRTIISYNIEQGIQSIEYYENDIRRKLCDNKNKY